MQKTLLLYAEGIDPSSPTVSELRRK